MTIEKVQLATFLRSYICFVLDHIGQIIWVWLFLAWAGNMVLEGTTRRGEIESILDGECEDKGKVQKNQQELTQDGMGINMNEITIVLNFFCIGDIPWFVFYDSNHPSD